jgi:hypothetical protein
MCMCPKGRVSSIFFCFDTTSHDRIDSYIPIFNYQTQCDSYDRLLDEGWSMIASECSKRENDVINISEYFRKKEK